jgi:hypothetical protein
MKFLEMQTSTVIVLVSLARFSLRTWQLHTHSPNLTFWLDLVQLSSVVEISVSCKTHGHGPPAQEFCRLPLSQRPHWFGSIPVLFEGWKKGKGGGDHGVALCDGADDTWWGGRATSRRRNPIGKNIDIQLGLCLYTLWISSTIFVRVNSTCYPMPTSFCNW